MRAAEPLTGEVPGEAVPARLLRHQPHFDPCAGQRGQAAAGGARIGVLHGSHHPRYA